MKYADIQRWSRPLKLKKSIKKLSDNSQRSIFGWCRSCIWQFGFYSVSISEIERSGGLRGLLMFWQRRDWILAKSWIPWKGPSFPRRFICGWSHGAFASACLRLGSCAPLLSRIPSRVCSWSCGQRSKPQKRDLVKSGCNSMHCELLEAPASWRTFTILNIHAPDVHSVRQLLWHAFPISSNSHCSSWVRARSSAQHPMSMQFLTVSCRHGHCARWQRVPGMDCIGTSTWRWVWPSRRPWA